MGKFGGALGWVPLALFCVGVVAKILPGSANRGRWAACGALVPAVIVFQSIAPVGLEARHIISILPSACIFAVAGLCALEGWLRPKVEASPVDGGTPQRKIGAIFLLGAGVVLVALWVQAPRQIKGTTGFAILAEAMLKDAAPMEEILVSSDATGEGMFISEVALREKRPGHVIQRASKSLATSTWSGSGYTPAFSKDEDVFRFLTTGEIGYVVLDDAVPEAKRREHHDQLRRVVAEHSDRFFLLEEAELCRAGEIQPLSLRLYRITRKN